MMIGDDPLDFDNLKKDRKADLKKFLNYLNSVITDQDQYYILLDEVQNLGQ